MNSIEIISKVSSKNLSQEETAHVMQEIFLGTISEQEIENFLLSLSEKGETSDEPVSYTHLTLPTKRIV